MRGTDSLPWEPLLLEDEVAISALLEQQIPDRILHCGGICDVSQCEANPAWAQQINVDSVAILMRLLPASVHLIYVSSDHVYGHRDSPCAEDTPRRPLSVYGHSRVAAEDLIMQRSNSLIIRPGLPIGPSFNRRSGHLDWLRYRAAHNLPITIVQDETRSAMWSSDLADRILSFVDSASCGVRNIAATQAVDRPRLAQHLCHHLGINPPLHFETRAQQSAPHLGRVELATTIDSHPLPSPLENSQ